MVKDLDVGDKFYFNNNKIIVVVRAKLKDRVLISKDSAQGMHGLFSEPFSSSKFEDLQNRVKLVIPE